MASVFCLSALCFILFGCHALQAPIAFKILRIFAASLRRRPGLIGRAAAFEKHCIHVENPTLNVAIYMAHHVLNLVVAFTKTPRFYPAVAQYMHTAMPFQLQ